MSRRDELFEIVRCIPEGTAVGYGVIGRLLIPPVSGLIAGKWMFQCPAGSGIPWWRVVGGDGTLKVGKVSPELAQEQRKRLENEGVEFEGDLVRRDFFISGDELLALVEAQRT